MHEWEWEVLPALDGTHHDLASGFTRADLRGMVCMAQIPEDSLEWGSFLADAGSHAKRAHVAAFASAWRKWSPARRNRTEDLWRQRAGLLVRANLLRLCANYSMSKT